ncbi:MAG: hypothetical protein SGBAC_008565 [Bacillariaceae sp.]
MVAFPYKLHQLLEAVENDKELSAIISWLPEGTSFRVHSYAEFEKNLLKKYFPRQTQVKSFKRQLQYYDFENFGDGLFSHPCFKRGHRNLCGQILHQLPTQSQKANGGLTRPRKIRGRKKKSRALSVASTSKMSVLMAAAAGDASVTSACSDLSTADAQSLVQQVGGNFKQDPSPRCVKEVMDVPSAVGKEKVAPQLGDMTPSPMLSAFLLSQQYRAQQQHNFAQLQHMKAMQMAQQQYLQQQMLLGSVFQNRPSMQEIPHHAFQLDTSSASAKRKD